jgi:hypothetical protein
MNKNYWIMLVASFVLMSGVCIAESITGDCDFSLSESATLITSSGFVLGSFVSILYRLDRAVVAAPEATTVVRSSGLPPPTSDDHRHSCCRFGGIVDSTATAITGRSPIAAHA